MVRASLLCENLSLGSEPRRLTDLMPSGALFVCVPRLLIVSWSPSGQPKVIA